MFLGHGSSSTLQMMKKPKSFTPSTGYDLTLIKIATNGTISYIQNRVNASDTRIKDIVVKSSKAYVAGSFRGDNAGILFPGGALTSTTPFLNGFVAAFNATDGADSWQKAIVSPGIVEAYGLAIPADNRLYAFGGYANKGTSTIAGPVDFGNSKTIADTNPTNSSADLFLVSYNVTDGTTLELHTVGASTGYETANILASSGENLYLMGSTNAAPLTFVN